MDISSYILGSLAIASITFTISITSVFRPVRELLSKIHSKIDELIHCPWCLSFWGLTILLLTWDVPNIQVSDQAWYNFFVTLFAMYTPIGLIHYVLLRAYEPVVKLSTMRKIEKLREEEANNS